MILPSHVDPIQKQPIQLNRAYLLIWILGALMLFFIYNHYLNTNRLNELTSPLLSAVREINLEGAAIQHEAVDLLRGEIDPATDSLWFYLDQSIWHLEHLVQTQRNRQGKEIDLLERIVDDGGPLNAIKSRVEEMKAFFNVRGGGEGFSEATIHQRTVAFDAIYAGFRTQVDEIEAQISRLMAREKFQQRASHLLLILFCVVMVGLATFQIRRYERQRSANFETLNRANRELARQIEDRRRAEASLQESEHLFRTIFNTSPVAIMLSRLSDEVIVDVNEGFSELTGYARDEVVGRTPADISGWDRFSLNEWLATARTADRSAHDVEFTIRMKDGRMRTALISVNTVDIDRTLHRVTVARDISDLKAVENDLRSSEERFRGLFESARDLIHILDLDGRILTSNSAAIDHLGLTMGQLRQRKLEEFVDDASRTTFARMVQQVTTSGRFSAECTVTGDTGKTMLADCSAFPVRDSRGEIAFIVIFQKDITDRKQAERTLQVSYAFMKIANENRTIDQMFREFMAAIKTYSGCRACFIRLIDERGRIQDAAPVETNAPPCELDHLSAKPNRNMCARVLNQAVDRDRPWFTEFGSYFYDGGAQGGNASHAGPPCSQPNRCMRMNVQSVALIPIRVGRQVIGLLQIADDRPGILTRGTLECMQTAALHVGAAIRRLRAEAGLEQAYHELERRVRARTRELSAANQELQTEIEERRLIEERLRKNRNTLQTVIDGISDALILVDRDMRIRMLNRVAGQAYHVDLLDNVIGRLCHQGIGRKDACQECGIPHAVRRGEVHTFERHGVADADRLERVTIYPVSVTDDASGGAVIRISDITEEKQFEQKLIQSEKMASLGILVSSIGHEINNPNNFIIFNIPILREYLGALIDIADQFADNQRDFELFHMRYAEFREDVFKLVDNIEHGASRIRHFVSNLRDFSQNSGNREKAWLELPRVVDKVLSICRSQIKKRVRDFKVAIPADQPRIYADEYSLEQVLLNLIVNAVQAADKVDSTVTLSASCGASWQEATIITVADNGCGIANDQLAKIFNPFFTTKPINEGTGLGLYVSHNLVQRLGGRIEVSSEEGVGSTFRILLPDKERRSKARV